MGRNGSPGAATGGVTVLQVSKANCYSFEALPITAKEAK